MKISVIMPVYNERRTIKAAVEQVLAAPVNLQELIIVDDGSTDGTRDIIANEINNPLCKPVFHPTNRGKGASIRTGLKEVTGDVVVIQDGDLEYDPQDLALMLKPIMDQKADVVYGSRFIGAQPHRVVFFWHMVGNRILTFLSNMLTNLNLTDIETCYKMFRTEVLRQITLEENRFGFEPEVTAKVAKLGCRIYEVGISYSGRTYADGK
ncbi:MAG: glycosyl transferase, partial [Verrucomicrobia bacterium 21-51-4]